MLAILYIQCYVYVEVNIKMWVRFYIFPSIGLCATGIDFLQAQHINVFHNVHESKIAQARCWAFIPEM